MSSTDSDSSLIIMEFGNSTKNVCMCVSVSIVLILLIIMTPLHKFMMSSVIGRFAVLSILGYSLYYNITQTTRFSTHFDVSLLGGQWDHMKTNIICSWTLSVFIFMLFFSVLKTFL